MKCVSLTMLTAGVLGVASIGLVNTVQASSSSNAAFADEFATWQRSVSGNAAYRTAGPDLSQPAADPVAPSPTPVERRASFQSEEDQWQAESRSDVAPDPADVQAQKAIAPRESIPQRAREFADQERAYQQRVSGNAMYGSGSR